jgi:hypothetical protein
MRNMKSLEEPTFVGFGWPEDDGLGVKEGGAME